MEEIIDVTRSEGESRQEAPIARRAALRWLGAGGLALAGAVGFASVAQGRIRIKNDNKNNNHNKKNKRNKRRAG